MIKAIQGNSEEEIKNIKSESVDIICIDPPYLYLKNQKLEREFDEIEFFKQCKRILTKNGFVIMFGRGISFYKWNCILNELGFNFKEEIIWDKSYVSSPVLAISRIHETVSIFSKGNGKINESRIPYLKMKALDFESIHQDVKRIKSGLNNPKSLKSLELYINESKVCFEKDKVMGNNITVQGIIKDQDRSVKTLQSITNGLKEKSIIKEKRGHYSSIHPTQKPVVLLERLIKLCLPNKPLNEILINDFFAGSFSCGEACFNLGVNFVGYEIDKEYFDLGNNRMNNL